MYSKPKNKAKANLGKPLEDLINSSNRQYKLKAMAQVNKVPTPTTQLSKIGPKGFFKATYTKGELVDYIGVIRGGQGIAFDAKMTKGKSFPLANLPQHQYEYILQYKVLGGHGFLIVEFTELELIYRLDIMHVYRRVDEMKHGGRKSIPLKDFEEKGVLLSSGRGITLDYLKGIT